ncbi:MAG: hypothetical protein Q8M02_04325 [Candidatus Didemnitutus sp.]|nr:hypothetical protein [Candidatus Didemnitutus sp.]
MNEPTDFAKRYLGSRLEDATTAGYLQITEIPSSVTRAMFSAYQALPSAERESYRRDIVLSRLPWWGFARSDREISNTLVTLMGKLPPVPTPSQPGIDHRTVQEVFEMGFGQIMDVHKRRGEERNEWIYEGKIDEIELSVHVTYMKAELVYAVRFEGLAGISRISPEFVYGFGNGRWDLLTNQNVDASAALMKDNLVNLVRDHSVMCGFMRGK